MSDSLSVLEEAVVRAIRSDGTVWERARQVIAQDERDSSCLLSYWVPLIFCGNPQEGPFLRYKEPVIGVRQLKAVSDAGSSRAAMVTDVRWDLLAHALIRVRGSHERHCEA